MNKLRETTILTKQELSLENTRRYDLDWLRVICITILLYYHVGMIYVKWDFHIKSAETSPLMENIMIFLHQWRMPLLFFISGAGTFYALGKRKAGSYTFERVKRLFIPLVFGMFVIVPPQIYIEKVARQNLDISYLEYYPQVLNFIPYPAGDFSWHHLWFVAYLFLYSLLALPLFIFLKSAKGKSFLDKIYQFSNFKGGLLLWVIPILLSQFLLKTSFPEETHALFNDWAYFTFNILIFIFGYAICADSRFWETIKQQRRIYLLALIIPALFLSYLYNVTDEDFPFPRLPYGYQYWWITTALITWFSILATLGYGYRYLNFNRPILKYLNEGVYPFYILHQTVILIIGYQVLQWDLGVWESFLTVSTLSFAACISIYITLIKPFKIVRFLFGLK